jgi:hypothetical protein
MTIDERLEGLAQSLEVWQHCAWRQRERQAVPQKCQRPSANDERLAQLMDHELAARTHPGEARQRKRCSPLFAAFPANLRC